MNAVLASNNAHKLEEIRAVLGARFDRIYSLKELNIDVEIDETGTTFEENSLIKARTICEITGTASIADDSGLCVDALDGAPGVYSARFAGQPCDDKANNALLLRRLHARENACAPLRTARFVSVVSLVLPNGDFYVGRGSAEGEIIDEPRGDGGFGYDPYFLSTDLGITFAEANAEQKNAVSHRARAIADLLSKLSI